MIELKVYFEGGVFTVPKEIYIGLIALLGVGAISLIIWKGLKKGLRYSTLLLLTEWIFLIVGTAVVFRETSADRNISLIPFKSYWDFGENSYFMECFAINMLNVAMFIPVGLLAGLGFKDIKWKKVIAFGGTLSIAIELLQLIFKRGLCEVDDVIHNTVGCIIGYGIASALLQVSRLCKRVIRA